MSALLIARIWIVIVALIPSCSFYFIGKNSDLFSKTKFLKLIGFSIGYASILGALLFERYLYNTIAGISKPDIFLHIIIPLQYGIASIIFFVQINKKQKSGQK